MQGYILNINRVRDEDLIVTVLTPEKLKTLYRFYGARHSNINLGFKIDFEAQISQKAKLPQLRNVSHLGFEWLFERERFYNWQQFAKLFYAHLKDTVQIDNFYYTLLEECEKRWDRQNTKRVAIEAYVKLLIHEGRLHSDFKCFVCDKILDDEISLTRGFLSAHSSCVHSYLFSKKKLQSLYNEKSTLFLDDKEVDKLWKIMVEGL